MYSVISHAERWEVIPESEAELPGVWLEGKEEMDSRKTTGSLTCET